VTLGEIVRIALGMSLLACGSSNDGVDSGTTDTTVPGDAAPTPTVEISIGEPIRLSTNGEGESGYPGHFVVQVAWGAVGGMVAFDDGAQYGPLPLDGPIPVPQYVVPIDGDGMPTAERVAVGEAHAALLLTATSEGFWCRINDRTLVLGPDGTIEDELIIEGGAIWAGNIGLIVERTDDDEMVLTPVDAGLSPLGAPVSIGLGPEVTGPGVVPSSDGNVLLIWPTHIDVLDIETGARRERVVTDVMAERVRACGPSCWLLRDGEDGSPKRLELVGEDVVVTELPPDSLEWTIGPRYALFPWPAAFGAFHLEAYDSRGDGLLGATDVTYRTAVTGHSARPLELVPIDERRFLMILEQAGPPEDPAPGFFLQTIDVDSL